MEMLVLNRPQVFLYRRRYQLAKRMLDVIVCLVLMPFAIIAMAFIALAILLDSPGPVLYIHDRAGRGGRRFRMYKFRTMKNDHDDRASREFMKAFVIGQIGQGSSNNNGTNGTGRVIYKPNHEARITRVGRILRKTSLDELPQFFNVLRGEMSLVGPRPNVPWEVEVYHGWHNERLEVLPGITGLAQVRGRSGISFDRIVEYDIEYIENQSLDLDLKILWWTALSVIAGKGAK